MKGVKLCLVVAIILPSVVNGIAPLIPLAAAGTAIVSSIFLANYAALKCKIGECCAEPYLTNNFTDLKGSLKRRLHGQHLVIDTTLRAIKGHVTNPNPQKALVLSLHGWTGGGKNYLSRIIAENLYKKGMESYFVHLFVSTLHFPHKNHIETYKDQLRMWIRGNVSNCGRQLFIFDEMDKMMPSLIDSITPYMDHHPEINGIDYRKSIFLLLSNTAGNEITKYVLKAMDEGKKRQELTFQEMEEVLTLTAFNDKGGGLWHSSLIEKNLISAFIPFLPLERKHIAMCVRDDLIAKNYIASEEIVQKVVNELNYYPGKTGPFSTSGCKKVSEKVDYIMVEI